MPSPLLEEPAGSTGGMLRTQLSEQAGLSPPGSTGVLSRAVARDAERSLHDPSGRPGSLTTMLLLDRETAAHGGDV